MPNIGTLYGPLEPLTLPKDGVEGAGRTLAAVDFNKPMRDLMARVRAATVDSDDATKADADVAGLELLRACLPGITDEEIAELDAGRVLWIFLYCERRLEEVTARLKSAGAQATATTPRSTPPCAPTTNSNTPSPASPARTGRTGSRSRSARSTARSTPSTV